MSDVEDDDVEILVHISAPSKATDDTRYRAFATAYLGFEPAIRHDVVTESLEDMRETALGDRARSIRSSSGRSDLLLSAQETSGLSDEMSSAFKTPDASFRGITDNLGTPRFYGKTHQQVGRSHDAVPSSASAPFQARPNQQAPSSFGNSRLSYTPEFLGPSLAQEASVGQNMKSSIEYAASSPAIPAVPTRLSRLAETEGKQSNDAPATSSHPVNFQLSSMPVPPTRTEKRKPPAGFPQPARKRQRQILAEQSQRSTRIDSEAQESRSALGSQKSVPTDIIEPGINEWLPPLPKASNSPMTTLDILTPKLVDLEKSGIFKAWRNVTVARELRPLERGYWSMNYSTWKIGAQAWKLLYSFVTQGLLGWGVSCIKFPEKGELRTYCWGGIVKHIFFILRVVSMRGIKATGGTWYDGDGVAVIVVPADDAATKDVEVDGKPIR